MTEARDVEEIVASIEMDMGTSTDLYGDYITCHSNADLRALVADWRAKKAEIERLREPYNAGLETAALWLEGGTWMASGNRLAESIRGLKQNPPPPPQSTASLADSQDEQA